VTTETALDIYLFDIRVKNTC